MIKWKNTACVDGGIFEDRERFESGKRNNVAFEKGESRFSYGAE
jgi:hypothetical protein